MDIDPFIFPVCMPSNGPANSVNQNCIPYLQATCTQICGCRESISRMHRHPLDRIYSRKHCRKCMLLRLGACFTACHVYMYLQPERCCLDMQAGQEMSVGDYYQSTYKIKLNPNLPCLNVGASGKPTYVPAELATVKRGQRKLKLDERQQAQMIREAAIKPGVSFSPHKNSLVYCLVASHTLGVWFLV